MIRAIFYSKFDTQEGPKVVHQVPDGAIVPSATAPPSTTSLFNFSDVSFFVIPRQELCGNLIHVCANGHRILGKPICMESPRYDRNEFIFNFCVVLGEDDEWASYKSVVQKLADLMCALEEQSGFLSKDASKGGEGKVYSLCETLMEDLNNYCECMIPIDELNTLNLKLFPLYPAPPMINAWQVPLFTVRYEAFMDENWDLTMQRIVPYINGVNSVQIISTLAEADFVLTCRAIRHLLYYGCIFLLDIFSFSAIYAPTAKFGSTIASDEEMQRECACYVNTRLASMPVNLGRSTSASGASQSGSVPRVRKDIGYGNGSVDQNDIWPPLGDTTTTMTSSKQPTKVVDGVRIVELYASLKQGQSVKQWYLEHMNELANIDVRRFITFGVIKGFLYRVHKYAYDTGYPTHHPTTRINRITSHMQPASRAFPRDRIGSAASAVDPSAISSRRSSEAYYHNYPLREEDEEDEDEGEAEAVDDEDEDTIDDKTLSKYLDGMHCFDQICTELEISEQELTARLKRTDVYKYRSEL